MKNNENKSTGHYKHLKRFLKKKEEYLVLCGKDLKKKKFPASFLYTFFLHYPGNISLVHHSLISLIKKKKKKVCIHLFHINLLIKQQAYNYKMDIKLE